MESTPVSLPPDFSLLFHEVVNFQMKNNPNLPMFAYADDQALDHTVTEISFLEFGRAAHRVAHTLCPKRGDNEGQVIMLIANCDTLLHHAVAVGMIIAGCVPFLVSPRNSAAAVADMMKKTGCLRIISLHHAHHGLIEGIRKEIPDPELIIEELPTLSHVFPKLGKEVEADPFVPYPALVSRMDLDSPGIYIHSSGSTGFPRPILYSHRILVKWLGQPLVQDIQEICAFSRMGVMGLPAFHGYGVIVQLLVPLATLVTACIYAPRAVTDPHIPPVIPTSDNVLQSVQWTECTVLMTVPTFIEQWALSPGHTEELKKLKLIAYGGGPLARKVGDDLCSAGITVSSLYGGTEFGCPAHLRAKIDSEDGDWIWMRFSNDVKVRWVSYGNDTYECQILATENHPLAAVNVPGENAYATSDLFVKHPTKDMWKIVGRADDVIILASGEKTVPSPMENIINSSPLVQGSVMFGRERNQVGILVEPFPEHSVDVHDTLAVAEFKNKIWPFVEEANRTAPAFSRIFKDMILVAKPDQPFPRTPKGTVQRKATIAIYEAEIDALYDSVNTTSQFSGVDRPLAWTAGELEGWLLEHANAITSGHNIDPKVDLFAQGFDSLSVTHLRNQILCALRASSDLKLRSAASYVSPNIVFENPTIELLAARVAILVRGREASWELDRKQQHIAAINAMIEKYSNGLLGDSTSTYCTLQNGKYLTESVVLLTGSTGGLGSFLLALLVQNPKVKKVYTLNRPSSTSSVDRQTSAFTDKGLPVDLLKSDKLVFIEADASQDRCGLSPVLYEEVCNSVTTIIHNAWRLDFNLSLSSFEPNVQATRNLVNLALDPHLGNSLRFVFTSSVSTAQSWNPERGEFPEEVQVDPSWAVGPGYGEAKYVCERIINKSGLRATSLRIGQIAGGPNGSWATTDWVPILMKSGIALGALPNSDGFVSWMRSEDVAKSVLDVAFATEDKLPQALNIVNPRRPQWEKIMSFIRDAFFKLRKNSTPQIASDQLEIVPLAEWVALLEKKAAGATAQDLIDIPAIKLLEFFRGMVSHEEPAPPPTAQRERPLQAREALGIIVDFSIANALRLSKTMVQMQPVGEADAFAWVNYWSSAGLFQ